MNGLKRKIRSARTDREDRIALGFCLMIIALGSFGGILFVHFK